MLPKHPLLQKCLKVLEAIPTFQMEVGNMPYVTADFLADGQLFIKNAQGKAEYIYEIKSDVTRDTIDMVIQYFGNLKQRLPYNTRALLITHQLSDQTVDRLLEKEIEFVDATGNIYLNSPMNYVLVRRPNHRETHNPSTEITSSTIQLIYLLLRDPGCLKLDKLEHKLAELAGMTVPTIQKHLTRLVDLNYLQRKRKGYKIVDYLQLFERWEIGYTEVLRPELLIGTFSRVNISVHDVIATTQVLKLENNLKLLFGGELGAKMLIRDFGSPHMTLHLEMFKPSFLVNLGLKQDAQGDVILLKTFGMANDCWSDPWMHGDFYQYVDPLLIHAELNLSYDDRVKTVAQQLFKQYIAPRADV
jgi:hypothetical protein